MIFLKKDLEDLLEMPKELLLNVSLQSNIKLLLNKIFLKTFKAFLSNDGNDRKTNSKSHNFFIPFSK